ncbi:probable DNA ligase [Arthrobacter sp. Hiyo4]|nr:probable DNA ligase [Arthrobacter sp. Hiyo4]
MADLDAALDRLLVTAGAGSAAERAATLRLLTAAATEREQAFIAGVLLGELRTGALEGVLTDAVARAADRPVDAVRRAAMLSGDLGGPPCLRSRERRPSSTPSASSSAVPCSPCSPRPRPVPARRWR